MASKVSSRRSGEVAARARRYVVEVPIRFKVGRETGWGGGRTANVSRSGVLFHCDRSLKEGTRLKLVFRLPDGILGRPSARVECNAVITRADHLSTTETEVALAASISSYRLVRSEK